MWLEIKIEEKKVVLSKYDEISLGLSACQDAKSATHNMISRHKSLLEIQIQIHIQIYFCK